MIRIAPYDPGWPARAELEIVRWQEQLGDALVACHHIGSTAVPGLDAKPIIDVLSEFVDETAMDGARTTIEGMGYEWLGAFGLPRRRYCRRNDSKTGARRVQAHGYVSGDTEIRRHLAFRDLLRKEPQTRDAYAAVKRRCAQTSPDGASYGACKSGWITETEARALKEQI
ncbi:MAG: GrpB family protein [Rhodobacteraceae bacterium]|nr:GrpB family protein [Paracoccaceae bacterium]